MDKWLKIPHFIRFLIIGGINAVISYIIYVIAILILGQAQYQLCLALQWIISSFISFLNQKFFVFCTKGNYVKEYLKCCSTWLVGYFLNVILLEVFVKFIIKNVYISQFAALAIVSIFTYILFKVFAFRKKKVE
jgi:putative flippase GtrA